LTELEAITAPSFH